MSNLIRSACVGIAVWLSAAAVHAEVRLPKIFGDHMVLQQSTEAPVWGWADAGEEITVTLGDAKATVTAGDDGRWLTKIATPAASGDPLELVIAGSNTITLSDVLIGEVWVASGQSNMEWPVTQAENPEEEIAAANYPRIRLFKVTRAVGETPQDDVEGQWAVCTPESVASFSAVAYFYGRELHEKLNIPIGLINTSWGGTVAEAWTSHETLASDPDFQPILERGGTFNPQNPNQPSVLYNAMIHPLVPFAIRGAIWYQGESNVSRAAQYEKLFPAMITDWRKNWGQGDFPFYFVQLAPFRYRNLDPRMGAELWEAQLKTLSLPNTGMAVTVDIGNVDDIHPKNKQDVGRRLALWALAKTYGIDVVYSGPLYDSMKVEGNKIRITFKHAEGGLKTRDGQEPTHFTIAGEDGEFVPATAKIEGETIVVSSDQVANPVAVRFAWRDDAEPNLVNMSDLPASPFRTDNRERVTENNR